MALRMLLFFATMTAIVIGLHVYVGWRMLPTLRLAPGAKRAIRLALAGSCVAILAAFFAGRLFEPGWATRALNWVGFSALGGIAILFALYVGRDVFLLFARFVGRARASPPAGVDASRREVLAQATNLAALGAGGVLVGGSFVQAHRAPVVESVDVPFADLPADLEGFTIAQISDLHLGPTLGRDFAVEVTRLVDAVGADLVAVTGDLVDGRVRDLAEVVAPLGDLEAPHGVFFVTGNHEYYWNALAWVEHLRGLGWHVLQNEHRILDVGAARLALGGVTDASAGTFDPAQRSDAVRAMAGAPADAFRLLLAHQPKSLYGAQRAGVKLQLSGHTHAGQIFPMNLLVHLAHPIVQGLGRFDATWVYVNRGTAYWGPPMRTGRRGEITRVRLVREA